MDIFLMHSNDANSQFSLIYTRFLYTFRERHGWSAGCGAHLRLLVPWTHGQRGSFFRPAKCFTNASSLRCPYRGKMQFDHKHTRFMCGACGAGIPLTVSASPHLLVSLTYSAFR